VNLVCELRDPQSTVKMKIRADLHPRLQPMNTSSNRPSGLAGIFATVLIFYAPQLHAQTGGKEATSVVEGAIQDSQNHPVAAAEVSLEGADPTRRLISTADSQGKFHFQAVPAGNYTLHAKVPGYQECIEGPIVLLERETKSVVLHLTAQFTATAKESSNAIAFSDEPAFTVAGVTDTTAVGGHGSGPIVRNSNALSKETASLTGDDSTPSNDLPRATAYDETVKEADIRAALAREDSADLHAKLAEIEEREGRPLEAVKEYQRAAEMRPTEPHLFAWGAELLLHHAPEPAIEVFTKGYRLYPQSSRMMLGLGAAWYAERSKEQAVQIFLQACDLNPSDPTPYLFLGRLQVTEQVVPPGWTERMKRFASLRPENAMAHYLYAVALIKEGGHPNHLDEAEAQLNSAIQLDPRLGEAYLQLGIVRINREEFSGAITPLQKAAELTPLPDEAHYRLAQVYRRQGNTEKANQEIAEFKQISEQKNAEAERERHEIPQFVYTLREQNPVSQPSSPSPH
jgi:tetratricopeptide (TPR) repeat protein